MGKQPYIPLYIGDWEQDTNCLSLEAEGAWLKIVFKCWKNQGIFMASIDSMCRLLKVDAQRFATLLLELKTNNICNIEEREDGQVMFISRRLVREAEISRKRADSGSKGGSKKQANHVAKSKQTPDNEYEIENEYEIDKGREVQERNQSVGIAAQDLPVGFDDWFSMIFSEQFMEAYRRDFKTKDIDAELVQFKLKVRNDFDRYGTRDAGGVRTAFQYQLNTTAKDKNNDQRSNSKTVNGVKSYSGKNYSAKL